MDDRGLVPDSMAVLGPDGDLTATFVVPFAQWTAQSGLMNLTGATR